MESGNFEGAGQAPLLPKVTLPGRYLGTPVFKEMSNSALRVWLAVSDFLMPGRTGNFSSASLAKAAGMDRGSFRTGLQELHRIGLVEIKGRSRADGTTVHRPLTEDVRWDAARAPDSLANVREPPDHGEKTSKLGDPVTMHGEKTTKGMAKKPATHGEKTTISMRHSASDLNGATTAGGGSDGEAAACRRPLFDLVFKAWNENERLRKAIMTPDLIEAWDECVQPVLDKYPEAAEEACRVFVRDCDNAIVRGEKGRLRKQWSLRECLLRFTRISEWTDTRTPYQDAFEQFDHAIFTVAFRHPDKYVAGELRGCVRTKDTDYLRSLAEIHLGPEAQAAVLEAARSFDRARVEEYEQEQRRAG